MALYDSYHPDILFGEVLLIPEWTQPTLSAEETRNNNGVPPPPIPILPTEFTVQLYNPDQQIMVRQQPGCLVSAAYWKFEFPIQTFRQPSASTLDRTQSDPTACAVTPKIEFRWKRESKFGKDMMCFLSGKSKNPDGSKKKHKEPDIPMAFFRHLKELTVYEPNLSRIEMEDPKGFEVVLLLVAITIRDVYFRHMREIFNISELSRQTAIAPLPPPPIANVPVSQQVQPHPRHSKQFPEHNSLASTAPNASSNARSRPPPTDPRSQWELDAESTRLKKQVEKEERERRRKEEEETRRVAAMVAQEQREVKRRQMEVDRETERLRRQFGTQQDTVPPLPPRRSMDNRHPPYLTAAAMGPSATGSTGGQALRPKRSNWWGLRSTSDQGPKLVKKQSAIF